MMYTVSVFQDAGGSRITTPDSERTQRRNDETAFQNVVTKSL
jgi:hypothetical protein